MGKILPGLVVSFINQKGGVGKSTLTGVFANYLHTIGKKQGLKIAVIDADDTQNSLSRKRQREESLQEEKDNYKIITISSKDLPDKIETLQKMYDIILVDLPGNIKQEGVSIIYYLIDVAFIPTQPSELDIDSTAIFYEIYSQIIEKRKQQGYKTSVKGIFNNVTPNLIEFKELYENRNNLYMPFVNGYFKTSKTLYQRAFSTTSEKYNHETYKVCEELLETIINHIK